MVAGSGGGRPRFAVWLIDELDVPYVAYSFRGTTPMRLPLFWDNQVQERLRSLAARLAQSYAADSGLKLVYVPQMTANGIEGHLLGVDMAALKAVGYTDDRWVEAAKQAARAFAEAFDTKALAIEVHEVNGGSEVPSRIIDGFWRDTALAQRVGAAIWWLSGRTDYQTGLLQVLADYPGDLYGQAIARSDQRSQFGNSDFRSVFAHAKSLRLRYLELWEYEFGSGGGAANGLWDNDLRDFNAWADSTFH